MSSSDNLAPSQREALAQLLAVTNGGDSEVAISVLESVNWDVQRAADIIFDTNPSAPSSFNPSSLSNLSNSPEDPDVEEPERQGLLSGRPAGREFRRVPPTNPTVSIIIRPLRLIVAILAIPYTLIRALLRALHIPIPLPPVSPAFSLFGLGLNFGTAYRPSGSSMSMSSIRDPKAAARRWVQLLEEETGCVSWARANGSVAEGEASGIASGSNAGLTRRQGEEGGEGQRVLPDFFIGSYEEFARACGNETDPRIGCVVIVSEEHDDVSEFKRSTLTDPEFVRLMQENNFLVWGGEIRDRDAWSASQKVQATTYPFVAFIALQPRRNPLSSTSPTQTPTLTILSRHQGPSIPSSTAPTSARTLVSHLTEQLLPRVNPFLERTRAQAAERAAVLAVAQRERERERALRAEQDRAYAESARKDKERIERKIAEEKMAKEEATRRSLEEERVKKEEQRFAEEKEKWEKDRMEWRRWGRRSFIPREPRPGEQGRGKTIRIGVRMPDGRRGVRFFGESDSLTAVYAFVDSLFIPAEGGEYSSSTDPVSPPQGGALGEEGLVSAMGTTGKSPEGWWGFTLASTYPRREIRWEVGRKISEIEGLRGGGQLVVEITDDGSRKGKVKAMSPGTSVKSAGSSDEYESESE